MLKMYHFQVRYRIGNGPVGVQNGTCQANSEAEVVAFIKRKYQGVIDYQIW